MSTSEDLRRQTEEPTDLLTGAVATGDREASRLASLRGAGLDDSPDEDFDRLVALAAEICDAPMALISFIDADRQWFKARIGVDAVSSPRSVTFCQHAIVGKDDILEVPDAAADPRFAHYPSVVGGPKIRHYAGAVLRDRDGLGLGTLCVLDRRPRRLSTAQRSALATLARQVAALVELQRGSMALAHAQTALEAAVDAGISQVVITLDLEDRIVGWDKDAEHFYGYRSSAVLGRRLRDVLRGEPAGAHGGNKGNASYHRRDGSLAQVHIEIVPRCDADGSVVGSVSVHHDASSPDMERLRHETYAEVVTRMADGAPLGELAAILCRTVDRTYYGAHATLMAIDPVTGRLGLVAAPSLPSGFSSAFADVPVEVGVGSCGTAAALAETVISRDLASDPAWDGWREVPIGEGLRACWSQPVIGPSGSVLGTFGVYWEHPHEPDAEERQLVITLAALTAIVLTARSEEVGGDRPDRLTGLMTRDGLDRALAGLDPAAPVSVVAVGLDRFELVNRQFGLDVGDHALQQVAVRLSGIVGSTAIAARFASDQFVVVLVGEGRDGALPAATPLAERLVVAIGEPLEVLGAELCLTASVGSARGRAGQGQGQAVLHAALAAAKRARRLGGDRWVDADTPPTALVSSSLGLVAALHRAAATDGIEVHYQPKVSVVTGVIEGFEALARWDRGEGVAVPPSEFIALAEEIGLITTIGEQVLRRACVDAAMWPTPPGTVPLGLAVNVSGRQLVAGRLLASVTAALADSGLAAHRLTLEVTETALAEDQESAVAALREVRALGVRVAIDDFGVGYSSLAYLSRYPIDELKIDQSFVARMGRDAAVDAIVRSVISLSHHLGLRCVAEGVEHAEQLDRLGRLECDAYQGYFFHAALPRSEVPGLLAAVPSGRR